MRRFFILTFDCGRTDLQVVSGYSMGPFDPPHFGRTGIVKAPMRNDGGQLIREFDSARIRQGERLGGPVPEGVRLWVSKGCVGDLVANPLSWLVLSDRLFSIFSRYAKDDMEVIEIPILDEQSDEPVDDYKVVNLLRVIQAANIERSVLSNFYREKGKIHVIRFAFDEGRVPHDVHIFRPKESLSDLVVSDAVAHEIRQLKGVALIETKTV